MKTKEMVSSLSSIIKNYCYHNIGKVQLFHLREIESLITRTYVKNPGRKVPNKPLNVTISDINRMKDEPLVNIILYIMQENKEPTYFRALRDFVKKYNLISNKNTKFAITAALTNLIRKGFIIHSSYGIYELTEEGRRKVV